MKFTGERFIPTEAGRIRLEHFHRYSMIQDLVVGKKVLDVASGEGYGSALLALKALSVVGVDISREAINHASEIYSRTNLKFVQGSATQLQFDEHSFDVVVSFETIEHLKEQSQMLSEIRRVLKPSGYLIISSPNRTIYSEESGELNEFHVKELDFQELDSLLRIEFDQISYAGQRLTIGSVIQPLIGEFSSFQAWQDDGNQINHYTSEIKDPVYFVAFCVGKGVSLPSLAPSFMQLKNLDLIKHYVGFAKWAKDMGVQVDSAISQIALKDQSIVDLNLELLHVKEQLQLALQENEKVFTELSVLNKQIVFLLEEQERNKSKLLTLTKNV